MESRSGRWSAFRAIAALRPVPPETPGRESSPRFQERQRRPFATATSGVGIVATVCLLVLGAGGAALWAQGTPVGTEFQVNTYTTGYQDYASVAAAPDGAFVVVWSGEGSTGDDTSYQSIQARRYGPSGSPLGVEFQVNSFTTSSQVRPSVAVSPDGGFVVVWESGGSSGSDTSDTSIQARRFASTGAPLGSDFQINLYTNGKQRKPSVSVGPEGGFVVVWNSYGSGWFDTSDASIHARFYDSVGSAVVPQFEVNTYTTGRQSQPSVSVGPTGDFVVVWQSDGSSESDTSGDSVQARRYTSLGGSLGPEFQVNTYTTSEQWMPSVAAGRNGGFVVVWASLGSNGYDSSWSVQAQRYASSGSSLGAQFQVNTYTTSVQNVASVSPAPDGGFVVVWKSNGSFGDDTSDSSIQARPYAASGAALGSEFQVNTYTTDLQVHPSVSVDQDGGFVVVWQSYGSGGNDSSASSIQGQRQRGPWIFSNGFESEDTSAWSSSVP